MAMRWRSAISGFGNWRRPAVRSSTDYCLFVLAGGCEMGRVSFRAFAVGIWATVLVLLCGGVAAAQAVKGGLVGNIVDASGLALPGVNVTITEVNTNISYSTVTNDSGNSVFSNLKDGKYRVAGELSGFKKSVREGVDVPVNATVRVDL